MAKKGKKQAKKKPAKRKPSEPIIVPERVLAGLTGKGDGVVGTELLELGGARAPFSDVRSKRACEARGGIWRKPPPGSRLPGVCASRPRLLGGCDGASVGGGTFVSKGDRCPPGLTKVRTTHPRYKKGEFYMCVLPGTMPRMPAPWMFGSGLGGTRLLPGELSFPMLLVGNITGLAVGTVASRALPALNISDALTSVIKVALGGGGAALYLGTKKSFPLGIALGVLPGAIQGAIDLVVGLFAAPGATPKELTGGRMGQLEPEQIEELRAIAEEMTGVGDGNAEEFEESEFEEPELFGEEAEEIEEDPVIPATFF